MPVCPACQEPLLSEIPAKFCHRCRAPLPAAAPPKDKWVGQTIADRFLIEKLLGEGGHGSVYLARHCVLNGRVAVKILNRTAARDAEIVERFMREAMLAGALSHPNLVRVHDFGTMPSDEPYLVMDYVEGVNLFDATRAGQDHCLGVGRTLEVGIQAARVLRHMHNKQVLHRDIKPANIMLSPRDGDPEWVTVLDLGIAKALDENLIKRQGPKTIGALGTCGYIAPETLCGEPAQPASDIYSLGSTLFEALTGEFAFGGPDDDAILQKQISTDAPPSARERRPDAVIPAELDRLIVRMLTLDPKARPSAAEVEAELKRQHATLPRVSPRQPLMATAFEQQQAPSVGGPETVISADVLDSLDRRPLRRQTRFLGDVYSAEQMEQRLLCLEDQLLEHVEDLGRLERKAARSDWPKAAPPMEEQIVALDREVQALEAELSDIREKLEKNLQLVAERQQPLRLQVVECTWKLQRLDLPRGQREVLLAQRLDLEKRLLQVTPPDNDVAWRTRRFELWERSHRRRKERCQALVRLARLLLAAPRRGHGLLPLKKPPLVGTVLREQMEDVLQRIEDTVSMLKRGGQRRGGRRPAAPLCP